MRRGWAASGVRRADAAGLQKPSLTFVQGLPYKTRTPSAPGRWIAVSIACIVLSANGPNSSAVAIGLESKPRRALNTCADGVKCLVVFATQNVAEAIAPPKLLVMYFEFRAMLLTSAFRGIAYWSFGLTVHGFLHRRSHRPWPPLRVGPERCLGGFIRPPIHRILPYEMEVCRIGSRRPSIGTSSR